MNIHNESHRKNSISVNCIQGETGFALPGIILALAMLGLLAAVSIATTRDNQRASHSVREGTRAFYSAEAGLNQILSSWDSVHYDTLMAVPGDSVVIAWQPIPESGARYRAVMRRVDGGSPTHLYTLEVLGQTEWFSDAAAAKIEVLLQPSSGGMFPFGVYGKDKTKLSGSTSVDSYNSDDGPYDPFAAGSNASVGSNGNVEMSTSGFIHGDATAGGTVTNPGQVTGTSTNGAPAVDFPTVDCPTGSFTPSVPAGPGISYNPATGKLTVSGGENITLPVPPTEYYFSEVTLSGGSTMTLNTSGDHVDIFISNKLTVSGGGVLNTSAKPTDLSIWGCGTSTSGWAFSGGSEAYYAVYAPTHKIAISSSSGIYGAIVGQEVSLSGSATVHYDQALNGGASSGTQMIVPGTWRQSVR